MSDRAIENVVGLVFTIGAMYLAWRLVHRWEAVVLAFFLFGWLDRIHSAVRSRD